MHTDSSARRTYFASRSASECTITVWMPSSRQARWTRSAISPRLAIKILPKSWFGFLATIGDDGGRSGGKSGDHDQRLSELDRLPVLGEHLLDHARLVGLDLVHQLHRLDDAKRIADLYRVPDFDERLRTRRRRAVERPDHRAFHLMAFRFDRCGRRCGERRR